MYLFLVLRVDGYALVAARCEQLGEDLRVALQPRIEGPRFAANQPLRVAGSGAIVTKFGGRA